MGVRQINVNGNTIGMNDLDETFDAVKKSGATERAAIEQMLLELVSKKNYIPPKQKSAYTEALYEEYLVFAGHVSSRKIVRQFPEIRVYGAGCPVCEDLDERIMRILETHKLKADYRYVFDPKEIRENDIRDFPTVTINGEIAHKGMVENDRELEKIILSAFASNVDKKSG